jgi:hypothetical protein
MSKKGYYSILGVARSASAEDIKRAYRKLAKQFHPDINPHSDAAARFSEIDEAHDVLIDPAARRAYDLRNPVRPAPSAAQPAAAQDAASQTMQGSHGVPPNQYVSSWSPPPDQRPRRRHPGACITFLGYIAASVLITLLFSFRIHIRLDNLEGILIFSGLVSATTLFLYCYMLIKPHTQPHHANSDSYGDISPEGQYGSQSAENKHNPKALIVTAIFALVSVVIVQNKLHELLGFGETWNYVVAFTLLFVVFCITIWAIWGINGFRDIWSTIKERPTPQRSRKRSKGFNAPKATLITVFIAIAIVVLCTLLPPDMQMTFVLFTIIAAAATILLFLQVDRWKRR